MKFLNRDLLLGGLFIYLWLGQGLVFAMGGAKPKYPEALKLYELFGKSTSPKAEDVDSTIQLNRSWNCQLAILHMDVSELIERDQTYLFARLDGVLVNQGNWRTKRFTLTPRALEGSDPITWGHFD